MICAFFIGQICLLYFCVCLLFYADGTTKLVGGTGSHEGRLEIFYHGQWGTVCDDGWTESNTQVVCRQLGYRSSEVFTLSYVHSNILQSVHFGWFSKCSCMCVFLCDRVGKTLFSEGPDITPTSRFGEGSGPILLDDVSCTGKEPSLLLCSKREWLHHDCTHDEDVNIACSPEHIGSSLPTSKTESYLTNNKNQWNEQ